MTTNATPCIHLWQDGSGDGKAPKRIARVAVVMNLDELAPVGVRATSG